MSAQSAKVIDFQAYRSEREARRAVPVAPMPAMPMLPPMAWVPVWFVPVPMGPGWYPAG